MNAMENFIIIQGIAIIGLSICLLYLNRRNKKVYASAQTLELKGLLDYGCEMNWHEESEHHCVRLVERYINVFGKDKDFLFLFYSSIKSDPRPLFDKKNLVTIKLCPEDIKVAVTEKTDDDPARVVICEGK